MRNVLLLLLLVAINHSSMAQLTISPGATLHLGSNSIITLENMDFVNNGIFSQDSGIVHFTGSANNSISGTADTWFYDLQINKNIGKDVILQRSINVGYRILFKNSNLFIGDHTVNLGRTGILQGEFEQERLRTTGTGQVIAIRNINGATNALPGNMGISITTQENLGDVIVRRGHAPQSGNGLTNSIQRYYEIEPQFAPVNSNSTLRLGYLDAELNGINEDLLQVFQSSDNSNWTSLGFTGRNSSQDYAEITGVQPIHRFTLSVLTGTLPVQFTGVNGNCANNKAVISWQTATEQNSLQFELQRHNGSAWTVIGSVPATGNSTTLRSYSITDNNPNEEGLYRVAEISVNGKIEYSAVLRLKCGNGNTVRVWPNPVANQLSMQLNITGAQQLRLQLWDTKGALVKEQLTQVQSGSNVLQLDVSGLPSGMYTLSATTASGQRLLTSSIIKQ